MKANRISARDRLDSKATPTPERKAGKPRTRVPPSVRAREARERQANAAAQAQTSHTAPVLVGRANRSSRPLKGMDLLVDTFRQAIESKNWDRLDSLMESMREQKCRFDSADVRSHAGMRMLAQRAPAAVLAADTPVTAEQMRLALELLAQGCDGNAEYRPGITVLDHTRQSMTPSLTKAMRKHLPELLDLLKLPRS